MKKLSYFAAAAIALGLAACSEDTITPTNGGEPQVATINYAPAHAPEVAAYSNSYRVASQDESVVSIKGVAPLANDVLESTAKVFLDILPEEQDNLNLTPKKEGVSDWTTNYLYVSNGKPFTLYPAYSQTASHDIIGIYYYDKDGKKHEENIFDTTASAPGAITRTRRAYR